MLGTWSARLGGTTPASNICTSGPDVSLKHEALAPYWSLAPVPGRAAATPTISFSFPASGREPDRGRYQVPSQGSCTNWRNPSLRSSQPPHHHPTPHPAAPAPPKPYTGRGRAAQSSKAPRVCSWGQLTSTGKEKRARRVAPSLGERRLLMVFLSEESRARVHVYVCVHARL